MQRVISILTVFLIGATAIFLASCRGDQISDSDAAAVLNGSFENVEDGCPVNWAFFPNPKSTDSLQVILDSENAVDGKHSLKLEIKQNDKTPGFRSHRIPVQSGKTYKLAMSVKTDGCTYKVNRIVQDALGKTNLRADIIFNTPKPSAEWQRHEETISIAEGEACVLLIFLIEGAGSLWCDDIQFEKIG
jgi:hypothetical protein